MTSRQGPNCGSQVVGRYHTDLANAGKIPDRQCGCRGIRYRILPILSQMVKIPWPKSSTKSSPTQVTVPVPFFSPLGIRQINIIRVCLRIPGVAMLLANYHLFSAISGETTGPSTPDSRTRSPLPPCGSVNVFLSWNDPAGASTNDYDLGFFDCALEHITR